MESILPSDNLIEIKNTYNIIFNAVVDQPLFCRVRSITLTRHPKILYTCQLSWGIDFWESIEDVGTVLPKSMLIIDYHDVPKLSFTRDILVTPKDQDGLGTLFTTVKNQLVHNIVSMRGHLYPGPFTYRDMCMSGLEDGTSYLVTSENSIPNRHIIDFEHRKEYTLNTAGELVLSFNGMVLNSSGEDLVYVPIEYNYKGLSLLYTTLEQLYNNVPITVSVIKNNKVITDAYKS